MVFFSFLIMLIIIVPIAERLVWEETTFIESNGTRAIDMNNQCLCDSVTKAVDKLNELVTNIPNKTYHIYAEKEEEDARNRRNECYEIGKEKLEKQVEVVKYLLNKLFFHIKMSKKETNNRIINESSKLFNKLKKITDERFAKLGTYLKETLNNTHQHFEKETKKVRSKVNIEIDSVNYRLQDNSKSTKQRTRVLSDMKYVCVSKINDK